MIKDVMVWLDGSLADEVRLQAVAGIARQFESHVVALIFNAMPDPVGGPNTGVVTYAELLEKAREAGDIREEKLVKRLKLLERPVTIRRYDVLANDFAEVAAREARTADTFVALRPNGAMDPERLIESVLFESGRHLYLCPETERPEIAFDRILVAWNGSRDVVDFDRGFGARVDDEERKPTRDLAAFRNRNVGEAHLRDEPARSFVRGFAPLERQRKAQLDDAVVLGVTVRLDIHDGTRGA